MVVEGTWVDLSRLLGAVRRNPISLPPLGAGYKEQTTTRALRGMLRGPRWYEQVAVAYQAGILKAPTL